MTRLGAILALTLAVLAIGGVGRTPALVLATDCCKVRPGASANGRTEVVVALSAPPLAHAPGSEARVAAEQRVFRRALARDLPDARVRWRYRLVANGFAVAIPSAQLPRLGDIPGVRDVFASAQYVPQLDRSPQQIGAPGLWGAGLETSGQGMKIGVIDTGVDSGHPFFDPAGYTMPAGFPKGQQRFTNAKVIAARAFAPPGARYRNAALAFDEENSSHGTHVAGIAAGNARTQASGRTVSGVAPRAYIGNYKALVGTDSGLSPNGNAPEIVAAIEAAVRDGMDVLNLSIGQPELEPRRDVVALALDAAAAAGVVSAVAAGNDFNDLGAGSVSSPANSERAITVGAVEVNGTTSRGIHAGFSSVGPTPISLRLKPDVAAPGVDILSSVPAGWSSFSGTSMASPHVAGAAALLVQRHPSWTVAQVKSALVQTGTDAANGEDSLAAPQFQGGGVVSLGRADRPLLFSEPAGMSFGLLERSARRDGEIALTDAGGGAGIWQVGLVRRERPAGASLVLPTTVTVPGSLSYEAVTSAVAAQGDFSGFVELRRGPDVRRVPFWGRVAVPGLARHDPIALRRTGVYRGTTAGKPARATRYRYPENPSGVGLNTFLRGPEAVYRVRITRAAANFGVVVTQNRPGSRVEPRVVAGLDENRLTGYAGLPVHHNPYLDGFRSPVPAAGALSPLPGEYALVFDSATRAGAGRFTFRYWINDVTPPTLRLRTRTVERGDPVQIAATDAGSGVYGASVSASVDGGSTSASFRHGVVRIPTGGLSPGRHRLRLRVSDYQETKNTENVSRILPNTRTFTATFTVR
ncbi:MAG: S8 family serine peptidase [Actinobacteria bacterium]|nr:S8 family serine peptidase [Actinomycetota bacterium]MBA3561487.1 S8 family serine peptidase [Actinomycetota bacterium]MBA3566307.1 S8 family serine peptidase [Actinomycetota bacterium]